MGGPFSRVAAACAAGSSAGQGLFPALVGRAERREYRKHHDCPIGMGWYNSVKANILLLP
jgi:hypothetical protein